VTVQEANAIATIDVKHARVTHLRALGTKDHSAQGLDPSDRDNAIRIGNWPVHGLYLPDSIASYRFLGQTFLVTANEGDTRAYPGFNGGAHRRRRAGPGRLPGRGHAAAEREPGTLEDHEHGGRYGRRRGLRPALHVRRPLFLDLDHLGAPPVRQR
jgi:hypothetical protein